MDPISSKKPVGRNRVRFLVFFRRNNPAAATRCVEYIQPHNGASALLAFCNSPFTPDFLKGLQHKSKQKRKCKNYERANRSIPKNVMRNIDV